MLYDTTTLTPAGTGDSFLDYQVYNGLDNCITLEVHQALQDIPTTNGLIYDFERAMQAPALEMMLRGLRVDLLARDCAVAHLQEKVAKIQDWLNELGREICGTPINPRSPAQLKTLFYEVMRLPEQYKIDKGVRKPSTNRDALEKLQVYFHAQPVCTAILAVRDLVKQIEFLQTQVDHDQRIRTSYNVAGTETGRWSSSSNAFGTGTNLQNYPDKLRAVFIADKGRKLAYCDLEQAESWIVAIRAWLITGHDAYLQAILSGDLHTTVARMVWPDLPWTGTKSDRDLAEEKFYREYSYRDLSKRGGHGCLTSDHEVLTPQGWVPITTKPGEILTWSADKSEFAQVAHWTDKLYTGNLHEFLGNSISAKMTADHRVPYSPDTRRAGVKTLPASAGPQAAMPLGSGYIGGSEQVPARLIAAFMADGHQKSTNRMEWHLKKERKRRRLFELCLQYGFKAVDSGNKITVEGALPKYPGAFQLSWTAECLRDFVDELRYWDGHESETAVRISSTCYEDLEWFQTFGRILGIGGAINGPRRSGFGSAVWTLQQNNRNWASGKSCKHVVTPVENCRVLCPTVPSTWFYVRRNGRIFVTGNSNYYGKPPTMAKHLKVTTQLMANFQKDYFLAFPEIPQYHRWVAQQLQLHSSLTTMVGRCRHFFGRPNDDSTLREAIAFEPQSVVGDLLNLAAYRIWRDGPRLGIRLLAQLHDAVLIDFPDNPAFEHKIAEFVTSLMRTEINVGGRTFVIPNDFSSGWNWGKCDKEGRNPGGVKKLEESPDTRTAPSMRGLDRVVPAFHD